MDELRYRVDLLSAMNQKLASEERMLRLVCNTSSNAFLYVNFKENEIRMFLIHLHLAHQNTILRESGFAEK